ncbi:MAG: type IV secretion system protein, partial [Anaplasma sp.]
MLVTSCGSDVPFPRCVSAENFNSNTTASVSAYYAVGNTEAFKAGDGQLGNGSLPGSERQVVRWRDTGFITDGSEIVANITGGWVPWAKHGEKYSPQIAVNTGIARPVDPTDEFYDAVIDTDRVCGPYKETTKTVGSCNLQCKHIPRVDDPSKGQYGRPCWLEKGYGAYLLFKRPGDPDPNSNLDLMEYPTSPTTHLGQDAASEGGANKYTSKGKIFDSNCQEVNLERGWKIYVKILDTYYHDNAGGYSLEFTQGVIGGEAIGIFETVRKLVRGELDKAGQQLFKRIVEHQGFKNLVFALLTLFLVISALAYVLGMVRASLGDVVIRVLKITLVLLLISPGSWDFFHNHLLKLFTSGVDEIIALVNSQAAQQTYKHDEPFQFMDVMIRDRIFSTVVWEAKARALITADWVSLFALLIIIIAVIFYVVLCLYGFIIYLTAFVGITFLIALMPIFFAGILFSRFKILFDGWLTLCISFSMQAILMFTLLGMFGSLIMHYYYRLFGFTACYNEWINIKIYILGQRIIDQQYYEWTPGQKYDSIKIGWSGASNREDLGAARYSFTGGGAIIKVPPENVDEDFRYVDYPFLDPDTKSNAPPGGVFLPRQGEQRLKSLVAMTNSLISSERSTSTARLVEKIRVELDALTKANVVDKKTQEAFVKVIEDREGKDKKEKDVDVTKKFKDPAFKRELAQVLTNALTTTSSYGTTTTSMEDLEKQYDYNIIKGIKQGYIVMWPEVFGLILVAFLVWHMREFVQRVAIVLSGGSMLSRTVASMYGAGFIRMFTKVPVLGTVVDRIDRGIDGVRLMMRMKVGEGMSAIAQVPEKVLGKVPVVGGVLGAAMKGSRVAVGALTSSYTEEDLYSMRSISPKFDYARAWIGAHLGHSPLDAMKYIGGHALGKIAGTETGSLFENIARDRAALLSNLRTLTIGDNKYAPSMYVPAQKKDEESPFARPEIESGPRDVDSIGSKLFDDNGNLHVHKENLWDAVDTIQGLGALSAKATDPKARERIDADISRLKDEISHLAANQLDEVPELKDFCTAQGSVDFDKLVEHSLARRMAMEPEGEAALSVADMAQLDEDADRALRQGVDSDALQQHEEISPDVFESRPDTSTELEDREAFQPPQEDEEIPRDKPVQDGFEDALGREAAPEEIPDEPADWDGKRADSEGVDIEYIDSDAEEVVEEEAAAREGVVVEEETSDEPVEEPAGQDEEHEDKYADFEWVDSDAEEGVEE